MSDVGLVMVEIVIGLSLQASLSTGFSQDNYHDNNIMATHNIIIIIIHDHR